MVNLGPSKGCLTCKIRKIKCNGKSPRCQGCSRSGRLCLWDSQQSKSTSPQNRQVSSKHKRSAPVDDVKISHAPRPELDETQQESTTLRRVQEVVRRGLQSLKAEYQTKHERIELQIQYQQALHELKCSISSCQDRDSCTAALLFALYEMIVHVEGDKVWQMHLEGALAMLRQKPEQSPDQRWYHVSQALQLINVNGAGMPFDTAKLDLLVLSLMLRLREAAKKSQLLKSTRQNPRKIDVQKLRVSLKQLYKDGLSIYTLSESSASKDANLIHISIMTMMMLIGNLCMQTGEYLQSRQPYNGSKEHFEMCSMTQKMAEKIIATAALMPPSSEPEDLLTRELTDIPHAVLVMWPLIGAALTFDLDEEKRLSTREMLLSVSGSQRVPHTSYLSQRREADITYLEVVDGLLLVSLTLEPLRTVTSVKNASRRQAMILKSDTSLLC